MTDCSSTIAFSCHVCGNSCFEFNSYRQIYRISSDCQPWSKNGTLLFCSTCGTLQKHIDTHWKDEIAEIYKRYNIYHWSSGTEQAVFEANSSQASLRSDKIIHCLKNSLRLDRPGSLLDIGCGNGAFLRSFSRMFPAWELSGSEIDAKYEATVLEVPGVRAHFTCNIDEIPSTFDLIVLIHVLEHIENPVAFLQLVKERLTPGGTLFIEVPSYLDNPFDLTIADHSSHFDLRSLSEVLRLAGFSVSIATDNWISKELSIVANIGSLPREDSESRSSVSSAQAVSRLDWLLKVKEEALSKTSLRPFGIFGSANAGTWLATELDGNFEFFVDENPSITVSTYLGKPLLKPMMLKEGSTVFIPLAPKIAKEVHTRLSKAFPKVTFLTATCDWLSPR